MSESAKTIFILGAGVMQLPALRAAKAMGWRVIVADGSREASGVSLADRFEHVDLKDREAIAEAVRRYRADGGVDGVFTAGTDFSATVAWAAEKNGLPGIGYETALSATDKARMRRVFRDHDVPQPGFIEITRGGDPAAALARLAFPLVVKPVDNMGSRGVRRIDAPADLTAAVTTALGFSRSGRVIVEEYVAGSEFSLDALVYRGEPVLCGLAERHIFFEPYFVEMGHTMPAELDERTRDMIAAAFFRGIRALGIDNGAAKGDIKLGPSGPMVGEIAARLSGGYMSGWTYPYASGVDLTRAALLIAVGLPPGDLSPRERSYAAERAFISLPGRVNVIEGVEEARSAPGIKDVFLRVRAGADVQFPKNNIEKCGNVISKAGSRAEAVRCAHEALASIFLRLCPNRPESDAFLFGEAHAAWNAFRLSIPENICALERLPGWTGDPGTLSLDAPLVLTLPCPEAEDALDWHGLSLKRALEIVRVRTRARFLVASGPADGFVVGKPFWKALLRAGAQGAVYLLDTLKALAAAGSDIAAYLGGAP